MACDRCRSASHGEELADEFADNSHAKLRQSCPPSAVATGRVENWGAQVTARSPPQRRQTATATTGNARADSRPRAFEPLDSLNCAVARYAACTESRPAPYQKWLDREAMACPDKDADGEDDKGDEDNEDEDENDEDDEDEDDETTTRGDEETRRRQGTRGGPGRRGLRTMS